MAALISNLYNGRGDFVDGDRIVGADVAIEEIGEMSGNLMLSTFDCHSPAVLPRLIANARMREPGEAESSGSFNGVVIELHHNISDDKRVSGALRNLRPCRNAGRAAIAGTSELGLRKLCVARPSGCCYAKALDAGANALDGVSELSDGNAQHVAAAMQSKERCLQESGRTPAGALRSMRRVHLLKPTTFFRNHVFDLGAQDDTGNTIVHYAMLYGRAEEVGWILRNALARGFGKDMQNGQKQTIAHLAVLSADDAVPKVVFGCAQPKLSIRDVDGNTAMHIAVEMRKDEVLKILVDVANTQKASFWSIRNRNGFTVAQLAISSLNYKATEIILSERVSFLMRDKQKNTLLHLAIMTGNLRMISLVMDLIRVQLQSPRRRSDINCFNFQRQTLIHVAILSEDPSIVELILNEANADLTLADLEGNTPLHTAVMIGNYDIVNLTIDAALRQKNFYKGQENSYGQTVLHLAVIGDCVEIALSIFNRLEPSLNHQNMNGNTPVHLAAMLGNSDMLAIVAEIASRDCDYSWNLPNKEGKTILLLALESGNPRAATIVLQYARKPGYASCDRQGMSALRYVLLNGHPDEGVVREVLRGAILEGEDLNNLDAFGSTAMHWAAQCNSALVGSILFELMPELSVLMSDRHGLTPLLLARNNSEPVARVFHAILLQQQGSTASSSLSIGNSPSGT